MAGLLSPGDMINVSVLLGPVGWWGWASVEEKEAEEDEAGV